MCEGTHSARQAFQLPTSAGADFNSPVGSFDGLSNQQAEQAPVALGGADNLQPQGEQLQDTGRNLNLVA